MIKHYTILLLALSALGVVLGLIGCGGGGGGGAETAQPPMTLGQFKIKADFICEGASSEQFEKAGQYASTHPGSDEADWAKPAAIPPLEKELKELKELPVPSSFESKLNIYLAEFEKALAYVQKHPITVIAEKNNPFEKTDQIGEKYELGDCSLQP